MRHIPGIDIQLHVGEAILSVVDEVADLRIAVFREWPYLYVGDRDQERDYLAGYAASPRSVCVVARDDAGTVVGASTGVPLVDASDALQVPFRAQGVSLDEVFYFGESVLLDAWRGRGVGHAFFDRREAHAAGLGGFRLATFCAVRRTPGDPRKPAAYRRHDAFWLGRGYKPVNGMSCTLSWKEPGQTDAVPHVLDFWTRTLNPSGNHA